MCTNGTCALNISFSSLDHSVGKFVVREDFQTNMTYEEVALAHQQEVLLEPVCRERAVHRA